MSSCFDLMTPGLCLLIYILRCVNVLRHGNSKSAAEYLHFRNKQSCLFKLRSIRTWNETVLSNEDKVSCLRIQMGLRLTPDMHQSIN